MVHSTCIWFVVKQEFKQILDGGWLGAGRLGSEKLWDLRILVQDKVASLTVCAKPY